MTATRKPAHPRSSAAKRKSGQLRVPKVARGLRPEKVADRVVIVKLTVKSDNPTFFIVDVHFRFPASEKHLLDEFLPFYRRETFASADAYVEERDLIDRLVERQGYPPMATEPEKGRKGFHRVIFNTPGDAYLHKSEPRWLRGRDMIEPPKRTGKNRGLWRYKMYVTRTPVTMAVLHELYRMKKDPTHAYKTTAPYYFAKLLITLDNHWD